MTRIAFVTGGGVGAGHFARGVAIERALRRRSTDFELRMFSDRLPYRAETRSRAWVELPFDPTEMRDPGRARRSALARALEDFAPDLLLVDFFWAHVHRLLPLAGCRTWLLVRWAPRGWLEGVPGLERDARLFERTIAIEPATGLVTDDEIPPIVIANPSELRPSSALRERFAVPDGRPLVLVAQAGQPGEYDELAALAKRRFPDAFVIGQTLFDADALFPVADWLGGADIIVGGAGYNTFWETRWLGLADRAHLYAFPRSIDDQAWRLVTHHRRAMKDNGADVLAGMILAG